MIRLTLFYTVVSTLFFLSYGSSAEEIYSQGFYTDKSNGMRVSSLPNYTVFNDEPDRNDSGIYFDSLFTFSTLAGRDKYSAALKIVNNATQSVLFEDFSPYFDLAFEDSESGLIVLVSSFEYTDFSLMILDQKGEVIVDQSFSYYLLEKFIKLVEKKGLLGNPGLQDNEHFSDTVSEIDQSVNEAGETLEEEEEHKIIFTCGGISRYIEQIKSLDFDQFGMVKGFQFISSDEHLYFNMRELNEFLIEQESILAKTVEDNFSMDCEQHNVSAINVNGKYIRKCKDLERTFVELWELEVNEEPESIRFEQFKLFNRWIGESNGLWLG